MEHPTINDLPNELLEMIFDHLEVDDLKDASLVCKRWLDLAFSGRRMNCVLLVPTFPCGNDLLKSNRKYRHLELREIKECKSVKKLLQRFSVTSLRIKNMYPYISHSSVRSILLEAPNLQHLSIFREPDQMNEMIEPLPVMRKLQRLEIEYNNPESAIHWHTITPSLQGLSMCCDSEDQLEQWRLFSGQLKHIYVTFYEENLMNRFYQMTCPLLEELSIAHSFEEYALDLFERPKFFRRTASLRRLHLDLCSLSKSLVEDVTYNNKKLTSLEISGHGLRKHNGEPGSLESLGQLSELKHLKLSHLDICIFRGCEALTSLQSLCTQNMTFGHKGALGFLEHLFNIAPQLRCLGLCRNARFGLALMPATAVQYICFKFTKLTHLQLTYSERISRDGLSEIDRLPHLLYLELKLLNSNLLFISTIPQNKVRCLTLHLPYRYDGDDLLKLPEVFPQLVRLNLINSRRSLRESTVDRLRQLLPSCVIKIYGLLMTNAGRRKYFSKWPENEIVPVWEKEWI